MAAGKNEAAKAASTPVVAVVARGRTVHGDEGAKGPGEEVLLEAEEANRLAALGFVILPATEAPEAEESADKAPDAGNPGPSVTVEGETATITTTEA